jgi:inosine/xanthosine triphosphatase
MIKVVIGSKNRAKNTAVETVFRRHFSGEDIVFSSIETNSRVRPQPITYTETIVGADNRAREALTLVPDADYAVGLEGGVDIGPHAIFVFGYVAIVNRDGQIGFGSSAWVELPESFRHPLLMHAANLGDLIREIATVDDEKVRHEIGTNGVLTGGVYTRVREFDDAVDCALARFLRPGYYDCE